MEPLEIIYSQLLPEAILQSH